MILNYLATGFLFILGIVLIAIGFFGIAKGLSVLTRKRITDVALVMFIVITLLFLFYTLGGAICTGFTNFILCNMG